MFPLPISTWIMIGLSVVAMGGIAYGKYEAYKLDEYKVEQANAVHKKEVQSQEDADKIRKEKDAQINAINNQLADALIKLRSRPSRNDNQANNGQGATGMSLSAEDATFLIREAARADGLRTALEACYKQYDEVK